MNPITELQEVSIGYKKTQPILSNVNLSLYKGELVALLGANGSGKSTLVKTWTGLIPKLSGNIQIQKNLKLSMVPQFKNINFGFPLKVKDVLMQPHNANFIFRKIKFSSEELEILERFGIIQLLNSMISECSGGQLQKVLICRSLLCGASLVFLDEPLDALDDYYTWTSLEILKTQAKTKNKTFFIITHNIDKEFISNFHKIFKIQRNSVVQIQ